MAKVLVNAGGETSGNRGESAELGLAPAAGGADASLRERTAACR